MLTLKWTLSASFVFVALTCSSYILSRQAANKLVGKSLDYVELSSVRITTEPFKRVPAWRFGYSNPDVFEDEFEVYTSLFGYVVLTNPRDLAIRLRSLEKLEVYPYTKVQKSR